MGDKITGVLNQDKRHLHITKEMKAKLLILLALGQHFQNHSLSGQDSSIFKSSTADRKDNSYILAEKDILTITVFDEENLATTQPIDGNNEIKVPWLERLR